MAHINYRRRYLLALLFAVVGGVLCGYLNAQEPEDDIVITDPHVTMCKLLEPYSYWWYALYCDQLRAGDAVVDEKVWVDSQGVMSVERTYASGAKTEHTGRKVQR